MRANPFLIALPAVCLAACTGTKPTTVDTANNLPAIKHYTHAFQGRYANALVPDQEYVFYPVGDQLLRAEVKQGPVAEADTQYNLHPKSAFAVWCPNDTAMHFSGSFQAVGPEGWFYQQNGTLNFYHQLYYAYTGFEGETDSTVAVYRRVGELPPGWDLTPEERVGEEGPVDRHSRYMIIRVDSVRFGQDPQGAARTWVFSYDEFRICIPDAIMQTDAFRELRSAFGNEKFNGTVGKIFRVVYPSNGEQPGYCYMDLNVTFHCTPPLRMESFTEIVAGKPK
jgi:hypothetical protein